MVLDLEQRTKKRKVRKLRSYKYDIFNLQTRVNELAGTSKNIKGKLAPKMTIQVCKKKMLSGPV